MSSYIVEQTTIHRIITHIDRQKGKIGFGLVCRQLHEMGYDLDAIAGLEELGTDLMALNYRATNQRYHESNGLHTVYVYQHERACDVQVLKSLQCLLYQCSEGDVPQSRLYQWLEAYQSVLMLHIINSLPEYAQAAWG